MMRGPLVALLFAALGCGSAAAPPPHPQQAKAQTAKKTDEPDLDLDKDHIPNKDDKCPKAAETYNGIEDGDGCPDDRPPIPSDGETIFNRVQFEPKTTKILAESMEVVHAAAQTLKVHPDLTLVEVEGFADDEGTAANEVKLSLARAKVVMDALVAEGVDAERLRAIGFGSYCPLDPGNVEKNRRVEFRIVATQYGPTDVIIGCDEAAKHGLVSPP
jgi:outer membrane protein OmpA-like peptidoglycan-associated protein